MNASPRILHLEFSAESQRFVYHFSNRIGFDNIWLWKQSQWYIKIVEERNRKKFCRILNLEQKQEKSKFCYLIEYQKYWIQKQLFWWENDKLREMHLFRGSLFHSIQINISVSLWQPTGLSNFQLNFPTFFSSGILECSFKLVMKCKVIISKMSCLRFILYLKFQWPQEGLISEPTAYDVVYLTFTTYWVRKIRRI